MAIKRRISETTALTPPADPAPAVPKLIDASQTTFAALGVPPEQTRLLGLAIGHAGGLPHPKQMPITDLLALARTPNWPDNIEVTYRNRIRSPLTAIRAYCILCKGGSRIQADTCQETPCALWAFRFGRNPLYKRLNNNDDGNAEATE